MTQASEVLNRVRDVLNDDSPPYRDSNADLLAFLSIAQRALLTIKPEAGAQSAVHTFTTTSSRQRLSPTSYFRLLGVTGNWLTATSTPGSEIRAVERDVLDCFHPTWPDHQDLAAAAGARIRNVVLDAADPLTFWCYPRPAIGEAVLVRAVPIPAELTSTGSVLALSDVYIPALVDCVCHLALRTEERGSSEMNAQTYLTSFFGYLGKSRATLRSTTIQRPRAPEAPE